MGTVLLFQVNMGTVLCEHGDGSRPLKKAPFLELVIQQFTFNN